MNPIARRLQRVEKVVDVGTIAPDQCDPKLIDFFQRIYRENFRMEMVPFGVTCSDYLDQVFAGLSGCAVGLQPVRLPVGQ